MRLEVVCSYDVTTLWCSALFATSSPRRTTRGPKFVGSSDEECTDEAPQLRKNVLGKKQHDVKGCGGSSAEKLNDERFRENYIHTDKESTHLCEIVFRSFAKFDAAGKWISPVTHLEKMLVNAFGYDQYEAGRVLDDVENFQYVGTSERTFVVHFRTPQVKDEVMRQASKLRDYKPHGRHVGIENLMDKKQIDDKYVLFRAMKVLRQCGMHASLEWIERLGYVLNYDGVKFVATLSFDYPFCVFHIDCLNIISF